jgi:cytochrome P450
MNARKAVQEITPFWLKHFKAPFLPEVKNIAEREKRVTRFLAPIVRARRERERNEPEYKKPDDMLQWIMDAKKKFGDKEDAEIARLQCILSFAAIHTTTMTALNTYGALLHMMVVLVQTPC